MVMMELKDVAKNYGRVTAVAGVSFQVLQGEILLIIMTIKLAQEHMYGCEHVFYNKGTKQHKNLSPRL